MAAGYNKKTRALSEEEYRNIMEAIMSGFTYTNKVGGQAVLGRQSL